MEESNDEEVCDFFEFLREEVRERLLTLSAEERREWLLTLDFCFHCGKDERKNGRYCQCTNDE